MVVQTLAEQPIPRIQRPGRSPRAGYEPWLYDDSGFEFSEAHDWHRLDRLKPGVALRSREQLATLATHNRVGLADWEVAHYNKLNQKS